MNSYYFWLHIYIINVFLDIFILKFLYIASLMENLNFMKNLHVHALAMGASSRD